AVLHLLPEKQPRKSKGVSAVGRGAERRGVGHRTRRMPGGGRKKARQAKSLSGQRNKKGLFLSPNLVPPNKNTRRDTAGVSVWWSVLSSIRTCFYRAKSREYHDIAELLHAVCR